MPHPADCADYLVCCASAAVRYDCLRQRADDARSPYPLYGTARRVSYYNALTATCER